MSGLKPITVNTDPAAEAHIYAEDDAAIYQSIFGVDGVLTIGQQCESQVISNNKVRVKDGVIVVGGHIARIPYGDYSDCEIANGQSGRNRNDIIIAKFVTTGSGGIDTYTIEVKQGAATTGSATDPALTQNDLYESGKVREMPLYRVKIEGLSIVGVEQMFEVVPTIPAVNAYLSELQNKTWTMIREVAGGAFGTQTIDISQYSEFMLTVGPFAQGNTQENSRVLASTIIPKSMLENTVGKTDAEGVFQVVYQGSSTRMFGGLNYSAKNTVQIRASGSSVKAVLWGK